jgi:exodeoxyribonuclease VII small subunit
MSENSETPSYSSASTRLEEILVAIERGDADIDELAALVQEAAGLVTLCRDKILAAQLQVETISATLESSETSASHQDEGTGSPDNTQL